MCFAWIFFRAKDLNHAFVFIKDLFKGLFSKEGYKEFVDLFSKNEVLILILLIVFFIFIEWIGRENKFALQNIGKKWYKPIRYTFYYLLLIAIFWFSGKDQQFIYFQF